MPSQYIASLRSIHVDIIGDKRVNDLEEPWYIIGHFRALLKMDNLGRLEGDPASLRALLFPRNPHMTPRKVAAMAQKFHDVGLFFLYSAADGDSFLQSARPDRQKMVGHMQRRSTLPPPDVESFLSWLQDVRKDHRFLGVDRHECYEHVRNMLETCSEQVNNIALTCYEHVTPEEKRREIEEKKKGREIEGEAEGKGDATPGHPPTSSLMSLRPSLSDKDTEAEFDHVVDAFHQHLKGDLTPQIATAIRQALTLLEPTTIVDAMTTAKAQLHRKPDWPYVKAILNNWTDAAATATQPHRDPECPFVHGIVCASNCASPDACKRSDKVKQVVLSAVANAGNICPFCDLPRDLCTCLPTDPPTDEKPQEATDHDHQQ